MNVMKAAYGALGLAFVLVFGVAYFFLSKEAKAPTVDSDLEASNEVMTMLTLESPAFKNGEAIPKRYTCDGENISPTLHLIDVPQATQSLVLIMDDPDIPAEIKSSMGIEQFDHWVLYNILPETSVIKEGETVGTTGANSRGDTGYTGACPPTQYVPTEHRYFFRLYALDIELSFEGVPTRDDVRAAMEGHILEETELMGTYDRTSLNTKG